jgi:hypothetical protein
MRKDMHKVIVERPRLRLGRKSRVAADGRIFRDLVHDDEDGGFAPHHLGMKAGYGSRKWLNENLRPLKRWLHSQVNRPWDKVYSELCNGIDRRNTVQAHIFTHIEQFVAIQTRWLDDEVIVIETETWSHHHRPLSPNELYVHPRTGILRLNRERPGIAREKALKKSRDAEASRGGRIVLNAHEELHCVDGLWYRIEFVELPIAKSDTDIAAKRWDVLLKQWVLASPPRRYRLPSPARYAISKQQLSNKELKKNGLTNKKAGITRPFAWYLLRLSSLRRPPATRQPADPSTQPKPSVHCRLCGNRT